MTFSGWKRTPFSMSEAIVSPSTNSMARYGTPPSSPMSNNVTMLGWESVPEMRASW
jgi:hypothetical protein